LERLTQARKENVVMWSIFTSFRKATASTSAKPRRTQLMVESLQERVLPSTSPVLLDARPATSPAAANHGQSAVRHGKAHNNYSFALIGSSAAKGRAQVNVVNGSLKRLAIHIQRAPASKTFSIFIDDAAAPVGTLKTNAGGAGKMLKKLNVELKADSVLKLVDSDGNVVVQGKFRIVAHGHKPA
jgi:hypothetical protein